MKVEGIWMSDVSPTKSQSPSKTEQTSDDKTGEEKLKRCKIPISIGGRDSDHDRDSRWGDNCEGG